MPIFAKRDTKPSPPPPPVPELPPEPEAAAEALVEDQPAPSPAPVGPNRPFGAPNRANPLRPGGVPRATTPPRAGGAVEPKASPQPAPRPFSSGGGRSSSTVATSPNKLAQTSAANKAATEDTFDIAVASFRDLMKIARKRSLLGPPEVPHMTTEYIDSKPAGMQIDWIAAKLGLTSAKLQADFCNESGWQIWPVEHFDVADTNLEAPLIEELRSYGIVPILAEQGRVKDKAMTGFITVLAEHGLVQPLVLSICRKHNLNYLFCFCAVVHITELQTLLNP